MIHPTISDIGRRVVYDARPIIPHLAKGTLVGIVNDRVVEVQFDRDVMDVPVGPIRVISNLRWADDAAPVAP